MSANNVADFYEPFADYYHLIFDDWDAGIARQAKAIDRHLRGELGDRPLRILDCSCGIGTQTLGLAQLGHSLTASDISSNAVARARNEAPQRSLAISFQVSDMTNLAEVDETDFDAVITLDNALPHLEKDQLKAAIAAMRGKLRKGGVILANIRDYDRLILEPPTVQGPAFYGEEQDRRIVHQVWDWFAQDRYRVHVYITMKQGSEWRAHHFVGEYRAMLRSEVTEALAEAGFEDIRWLMPPESGFQIPAVMARNRRA